MPPDLAAFRKTFPELPAARYPDDSVIEALETADMLVNRVRFGRFADKAVMTLAAHYVVTNPGAGGSGANPGAVPAGAVTSKGVGGASIGYDVSVGAVAGLGIYNATAYGRRYATWLRMFGAGGVQL